MKKVSFIALFSLIGYFSAMGQYVDLGLPSGTLWKQQDEPGKYRYDEAVELFGRQLPERRHLVELKNYCHWTWCGNGFNVKGPNGNYIFIPLRVVGDGKYTTYIGYWSSTLENFDNAWGLRLSSRGEVRTLDHNCGCNLYVRLVKKQ